MGGKFVIFNQKIEYYVDLGALWILLLSFNFKNCLAPEGRKFTHLFGMYFPL